MIRQRNDYVLNLIIILLFLVGASCTADPDCQDSIPGTEGYCGEMGTQLDSALSLDSHPSVVQPTIPAITDNCLAKPTNEDLVGKIHYEVEVLKSTCTGGSGLAVGDKIALDVNITLKNSDYNIEGKSNTFQFIGTSKIRADNWVESHSDGNSFGMSFKIITLECLVKSTNEWYEYSTLQLFVMGKLLCEAQVVGKHQLPWQ